MEIGDLVIYCGRTCRVRGVEPMSLPDRRVELEDAGSGEVFQAPLDGVETLARDGPPSV